jgi:4-oxalocrotonate tautomerase
MPYVNVRITRDDVTKEQKAEIIKGMTDVLVRVLDKDPARTFVVIDEVDLENWGLSGISVEEFRRRQAES